MRIFYCESRVLSHLRWPQVTAPTATRSGRRGAPAAPPPVVSACAKTLSLGVQGFHTTNAYVFTPWEGSAFGNRVPHASQCYACSNPPICEAGLIVRSLRPSNVRCILTCASSGLVRGYVRLRLVRVTPVELQQSITGCAHPNLADAGHMVYTHVVHQCTQGSTDR